MRGRIQFITHQGKQILLVDLTNCTAAQVAETVRVLPDHVTAQPLGSVLVLGDFTGAAFDEDTLRAMQESAVFDKPYIKKSAWVGAEYIPMSFRENIKSFSRREFPTFKKREEALDWLAKD